MSIKLDMITPIDKKIGQFKPGEEVYITESARKINSVIPEMHKYIGHHYYIIKVIQTMDQRSIMYNTYYQLDGTSDFSWPELVLIKYDPDKPELTDVNLFEIL